MKLIDCPQLVIYLVLAVMGVVSYILSGRFDENGDFTLVRLVSMLIPYVLMSGLLYWLCSIKYYKTAWVVLLLPTLLGFALIMGILGILAGIPMRKVEVRRPRHGHWR